MMNITLESAINMIENVSEEIADKKIKQVKDSLIVLVRAGFMTAEEFAVICQLFQDAKKKVFEVVVREELEHEVVERIKEDGAELLMAAWGINEDKFYVSYNAKGIIWLETYDYLDGVKRLTFSDADIIEVL